MTIQKLHDITKAMIAKGEGPNDVAIDFATFREDENGTILAVFSAEPRNVRGVDDSGSTGDEYPMLVLSGEIIL